MWGQFCQAEIQNLGLARPASRDHENIRGLNVAVDDAFLVRCVQPIRNLNGEIEQRVDL